MTSHLEPSAVALMQTASQWIHAGELDAPVSGDKKAVQEFAGKWHLLLEVAAENVQAMFDMKDSTFARMKANESGCIACTVADPSTKDCSLVFVSRGFEQMTNYNSSMALGKNCRFLQLSEPELNEKLNGEEIKRMRHFCKGSSTDRDIVSLLLNEQKTGERFWNLLHMEFVEVHAKPYILGVQTVLELPVPKLLRAGVGPPQQFVARLAHMLSQARQQLSVKKDEKIVEKAKVAMQNIIAFMEIANDDFEGDHYVPRSAVSCISETEMKGLLRQKSSICQMWDMAEYNGEALACTVADPAGQDCPLVYVSRLFESMTGYACDFAVGRNCRFLQPNNRERNRILNERELDRMRRFCEEAKNGKRFIGLLINEKKNGEAFFNLLVMEHVELVQGQLHIVGVQTNLEGQDWFLESTLAYNPTALEQLIWLRRGLQSRERQIGEHSLRAILEDSISDCSGVFQHNPTLRVEKGRSAQGAWLAMKGLPFTRQAESRDHRMARKLFAKKMSLEEIAEVLELDVGQTSVLLGPLALQGARPAAPVALQGARPAARPGARYENRISQEGWRQRRPSAMSHKILHKDGDNGTHLIHSMR